MLLNNSVVKEQNDEKDINDKTNNDAGTIPWKKSEISVGNARINQDLNKIPSFNSGNNTSMMHQQPNTVLLKYQSDHETNKEKTESVAENNDKVRESSSSRISKSKSNKSSNNTQSSFISRSNDHHC